MPLPPALAAKLAKRGLISQKQKSALDPLKRLDYKGYSACPNKSNIFHECTIFCETHWKGVPTPDPKYVRNMQKLLMKYPLPNNWTEIFDKGLGRYYYWNVENDLVTWLPPKHPKATITKSAAKLREKHQDKRYNKEDMTKKDSDKGRDRDRDSDDEDRNYRSKHSDRRDRDKEKEREEKRNKRDREERRREREKRKREEPLDPMDPAAYSDIPQGTWSDGLETNKTRADNTASGVLFQQRPYPAPGAVLAANREKEDKDWKK